MRDRAAAAARRISAATAAAGVAMLLITACNEAETPDPTLTSPPVSSTPPTAAPSPSRSETKSETPEERGARLAGEAVVKYWAVVDDLAAHPEKSLNLLDPVARDQARAQRQNILGTYSAKGWVQTGSVDLTNVKATTNDGKRFTVTACLDVSGVDLVDAKGESQVNPDRPDQWSYSYTVLDSPQGFVVTEDKLEGKPC